jgi:Tfp pilus assembly protein PilX
MYWLINSRLGVDPSTAGGNRVMEKQTAYKRSERGVALIFALLSILVLSILAVAIMSTSQAQIWTSLNYRLTAQARYAAEAGVQEAMGYLSSANYTPPSGADLASYTLTTNPVQYNGQPVVLSSVTTATNYYDSVSAHYSGYAGAAAGSLPNESNVSYAATATLLRMAQVAGTSWLSGTGGVTQTWQITSVATISGVRNSTVQVVETFERSSVPVFQYGLEALGTGCGAIDLAGGDYTDSYNSSLGSYASQTAGTGGNIATNGNVKLGNTGGLAQVNGKIGVTNPSAGVGACPAHNVTDSGSSNYAGLTSVPSIPVKLPWGCTTTPCYPPGTNITTNQNVSTSCTSGPIAGCSRGTTSCPTCTTISITPKGSSSSNGNVYTLAPGSYGNLTMSGNDVFHVTAGTYSVNSINFGGSNAQIVVDSGPVIFNLVGNCSGGGCPNVTEPGGYMPAGWTNPQTDVIYGAGFAGFNVCALGVVALRPGDATHTYCGTSTTPGVTANPANFQIVYGGTDLIRVGGMPNAAVTYAPLASYLSPGGAVGYYGSIITSQFADTSASPFHYDTAQQNIIMKLGQMTPVGGFSWSKF